jgi:hypothetical protein
MVFDDCIDDRSISVFGDFADYYFDGENDKVKKY